MPGRDASLAATLFPLAELVPVTRQVSTPKMHLYPTITIPNFVNSMPPLPPPPLSLLSSYSITNDFPITFLLRFSSPPHLPPQTASDVLSAFPEMLKTYSDIYWT